MNKSPVLAAVLHFFLFGGGYIYNGRQVARGVALTVAVILIRYGEIAIYLSGQSRVFWYYLMAGLVILQFAFASDAYKEAKSLNTPGESTAAKRA
jgi:hypothetical protein